LKLALATYQPSSHISQDDSIFQSLANLKGTGVQPTTNIVIEEALFESGRPVLIVLLFRKIASNSIIHGVLGLAAGQPRERSAMPCRSYPLRQGEYCCCGHQSAKSITFRVRILATI